MRKKSRLRKYSSAKKVNVFDRGLLALTLVLTIIGIVAVADVSVPQSLAIFSTKFYFVKQQIIWAIIGIAALFVSMFIHYSVWKRASFVLFAITLLLLVAVLVPNVGTQALGARRWILVGPVNVQPSEVAKLALVVLFAKLADSGWALRYYVISLGLLVGLVLLQPDLGTSIVIAGVGLVQLFVAGASVIHLFLLFVSASIFSVVFILTSEYRQERLETFLNMSADPLGSAYHVRQILIALGSGGLLGVGLGQSRQKHLFLPETATDSVFAVIAEELGFIGASALIILLSYFVYRLFKIASQAPDTFSKVLGAGIASWIGGQIFLNIASMVALTPLTGIPLPFFSYGGSSLTMVLVSVGILLNISKYASQRR